MAFLIPALVLPYLVNRQIDRVITGIGDSDGTIHTRDNRDLKRIVVRDCDFRLILGSRHLVAVRRAARRRAGDAFCDGVGASCEVFERVAAAILQGSRCVNNVPRRILHGEREIIIAEVARRQVLHVLGDRQVSGLRDEGVGKGNVDQTVLLHSNLSRETCYSRIAANLIGCRVFLCIGRRANLSQLVGTHRQIRKRYGAGSRYATRLTCHGNKNRSIAEEPGIGCQPLIIVFRVHTDRRERKAERCASRCKLRFPDNLFELNRTCIHPTHILAIENHILDNGYRTGCDLLCTRLIGVPSVEIVGLVIVGLRAQLILNGVLIILINHLRIIFT